MKLLFIGEKRSKKAIQMRVRWESGRLAAKQLFDALYTIGINPKSCIFINWFESGNPTYIKKNHTKYIIVGMGRKVQKVLTQNKIKHLQLVHPAARGLIRKKERYIQHVKEVLKEI